MPQEFIETQGAIFDIKPVDETGNLDVAKMHSFQSTLDLRRSGLVDQTIQHVAEPVMQNRARVRAKQRTRQRITSQNLRPFVSLAAQPTPVQDKAFVLHELESELNKISDPREVLIGAGARMVYPLAPHKPRCRPIVSSSTRLERDFHRRILEAIKQPISQDKPDNLQIKEQPAELSKIGLTNETQVFGQNQAGIHAWYARAGEIMPAHGSRNWRQMISRALVPVFLCAAFVYVGVQYGIGTKDMVLERGTSGIQALESARDDLATLNFVGASEDFSLAYEKFVQAGDKFNIFGANIGKFISGLPGGSKLKSANSIIEIGKLIAEVGQSMSDALSAVSRTSVFLNQEESQAMFFGNLLSPVHEALSHADQNLARIEELITSVNIEDIPENEREQFSELGTRMPEFRELVVQALDYTQFMERLAGTRGEKRYLVLFLNTSEMRPTGGFPGSYGVITFENGKFKEFFADDVYRIDGQLKELYVPPLQLQHITPNWAMRDAAWFMDFSVSARKVAEFYEKESGNRVDGVLTINPKIVSRILDAVGSLSMPEYDLALTGANFLAEVQNEVEYGENKKLNQPKKIIVDIVPRLLTRLASVDRTTWLSVVQAFMTGMEERDILMYFTDAKLQQFVRERGFSGEIADSKSSDYLMVAFTNIKGSKTDAVTDTSLALNTKLEQSSVRHTLTIMRHHTGGSSKYGFYNRQNSSFVRVLVPKGSKLIRISGNSQISYAPMMNYSKAGFLRDPDLGRLEATMHKEQGITVFEESSKTEFGFWMIVDPGEIKTVEIEYEVPSAYAHSNYQIYIQKQPGLEVTQLEWALHVPPERIVRDASVRLTVADDNVYRFVGPISKDLSLQAILE